MNCLTFIIVLVTLFTSVLASTITELHRAFKDAVSLESVTRTGTSLSSTSLSCTNSSPVFGFSSVVADPFNTCALENNKVCPLTGSCDTSTCSLSSAGGLESQLLCGTPITDSVTVSVSQGNGQAQSLSCPSGKAVIFGVATQHTPNSPSDCPQNNILCPIGDTSCSTAQCLTSGATVKTIRLLCGPPSLAASLKSVAATVKTSAGAQALPLTCSWQANGKNTLLVGMNFLWEPSAAAGPRHQICRYGVDCAIPGSIPSNSHYFAVGICVPAAAPTPSPTPYPTPPPVSKSPTLAPTSRPTTLKPTVSPTAFPTASPSKYPTLAPTAGPTKYPTLAPTSGPTKYPTPAPSRSPSRSPTATGQTYLPSASPTAAPTAGAGAAPAAGDGRDLLLGAIMAGVGSAVLVLGGAAFAKRKRSHGDRRALDRDDGSDYAIMKGLEGKTSGFPLNWASMDPSKLEYVKRQVGLVPVASAASEGSAGLHRPVAVPLEPGLMEYYGTAQGDDIPDRLASRNMKLPVWRKLTGSGKFSSVTSSLPSVSGMASVSSFQSSEDESSDSGSSFPTPMSSRAGSMASFHSQGSFSRSPPGLGRQGSKSSLGSSARGPPSRVNSGMSELSSYSNRSSNRPPTLPSRNASRRQRQTARRGRDALESLPIVSTRTIPENMDV